jgi:phosphate transport system substrate-binding protein
VLAGCLLAENAVSEPLIFAGSGSNLPATRLLIKSFKRLHPEINLEEPTNIGSAGAIQAVADGAVTIGLISRPLLGKEANLGLVAVPYARTAVVIGANSMVKDKGITFNELNRIYRGDKTTWGDGNKIIVLSREPGESSIYVLEENVPGFREVYADSIKNNRWSIIMKDEGMNQKIESLPYSIGFSDMGAIISQKLKINALKLNGISPTPKNVMNGAYPLFKTLSFVYRSDRLTKDMQAYLSYVCSAEGEKILLNNGYIPFCDQKK